MSNLVYHRRFPIEWGHCDPAGIVFNSRFFEFFDWSTWLLFEQALGVRPADLGPTYGIMGIPLVDAIGHVGRSDESEQQSGQAGLHVEPDHGLLQPRRDLPGLVVRTRFLASADRPARSSPGRYRGEAASAGFPAEKGSCARTRRATSRR